VRCVRGDQVDQAALADSVVALLACGGFVQQSLALRSFSSASPQVYAIDLFETRSHANVLAQNYEYHF